MFEDDDRDEQIDALRKRVHELETKGLLAQTVLAAIIKLSPNREAIGELYQEIYNTLRGALVRNGEPDDDAIRYAAEFNNILSGAMVNKIL